MKEMFIHTSLSAVGKTHQTPFLVYNSLEVAQRPASNEWGVAQTAKNGQPEAERGGRKINGKYRLDLFRMPAENVAWQTGACTQLPWPFFQRHPKKGSRVHRDNTSSRRAAQQEIN
jgi:hypothetical protein